MDIIEHYFPGLTDIQKQQYSSLKNIYEDWNKRINVISRKDMDNFYLRHVLHSMVIGKFIPFMPGTTILDVGTGGGFPGIPLAILFPHARFTLLDSIGKKIKVVNEIVSEMKLFNVTTVLNRIEDYKEKSDFIVCRAVTSFPLFVRLTTKNIITGGTNKMRNGIIYLKGGDLKDELQVFKERVSVINISDYLSEPFFETKRIVYLPF